MARCVSWWPKTMRRFVKGLRQNPHRRRQLRREVLRCHLAAYRDEHVGMTAGQLLILGHRMQDAHPVEPWHQQVYEDDERVLACTQLLKPAHPIARLQDGMPADIFEQNAHRHPDIHAISTIKTIP